VCFQDGIHLTFAGVAYDLWLHYADRNSTRVARRERPQVLSVDGKPAFLFTGVDPHSGMSWTQVQPIVTGASAQVPRLKQDDEPSAAPPSAATWSKSNDSNISKAYRAVLRPKRRPTWSMRRNVVMIAMTCAQSCRSTQRERT
jgi:hypothetical protein